MGRELEAFEVSQALATTQLLTLTGAGGSGKTRLALEVARDLVDAYPDGVWLVELAPLSGEELVPKAVAEALGVTERPQEPIADTLVEILGDKQLLLVLDNCEHLVEAAAGLVDGLLDSCPRVRILATSREALGVEGEARWLVPPLSAPEQQRTPTQKELEDYESVRLFVERARGRDPSFALNPHNAHAVAGICRKLEGIPLAIELASARVGTLSVEQISERLEGSLELLTRGIRTAVPRQQTLKGTLDWSYDLLSEPEKVLFRRLSVFAGGWTLEAAEAVGSGEDVAEGEVLDLHSGLVEKSLVVAKGSDQGGVRYRFLEPVRQYAQEKLEEGDHSEEVVRLHADFFLALAKRAEVRLWGSEDTMWLRRLEGEHDNLKAVLSWALGRGGNELALRLAGAMWPFWEQRGYYNEGRNWLEQALEKEGRASAAARAKALKAVGWLAHAQIDVDRAEVAAREGLKLSAEAEIDGSFAASFQRMLAVAARSQGDYERSQELAEESLALSQGADDKLGIVDSLLELGISTECVNDYERAKGLYEEGILLAREFGYLSTLGWLLFSQGSTLLLEGDYERSAALIEEAETLFREREYKGRFEFILNNLGWAVLLGGDPERARTSFAESLTLCIELGDRLIASDSLQGMACLCAAEGTFERAARLFGAAEALREAVAFQIEPEEEALSEPYLTMARSRLDVASWEVAFAEGRAMGLEEAIEYALSAEKPSATPPPSTPERPAGLTSREVEVLGLVATGLTSAQVATQLFLSTRTVDTHLTSIYHKLGVTSRAAATRFASEHGLA